ncbi:MAG: hypothetical protein JXR96_00770 [Deltaproteobacteria bacterium]|nr:hypothetical protein [Deltaproteobacteria bacterium]
MWLFCLALLAAAPLVPVEPGVHPDDFLSISCSRDQCLLLDGAGGLFSSQDAGRSLRPRARLASHGINAIRLAGSLRGWGLDRRGGLWLTRDGGRSFSSSRLPSGEPVSAMRLAADGGLWLGTRTGTIWQRVDGEIQKRGLEIGGAVLDLAVCGQGESQRVYALRADGTLFVGGARGGYEKALRLEHRALGVAASDKSAIVAGCKGAVAWSRDGARGQLPAGVDRGAPEGWQEYCLRPADRTFAGRFVLFGIPGYLLLVEVESGNAAWLRAPPDQIWRDLAPWRDGALVVGHSGARGELGLQDGQVVFSSVGEVRPSWTDIVALGRKDALRCDMQGRCDRSRDGGRSWESIRGVGQALRRLSFADTGRGFALAGLHEVLGTRDGGRSFQAMGRWDGVALRDVFCLDAMRVWLVGSSGAVIHSVDGGKSWTQSRIPGFNRDLNRVQFLDPQHGFCVGDHQAVFSTSDGGRTWQSRLSGRGSLWTLHFADRKLGWVAGNEGLVMYTIDGGKSWVPKPLGTAEPVYELSFSGRLRGLASTSGGALFLTNDGGDRWRRVDLGTLSSVTCLACWSSARCLVGGERGLLLLGNPFRYFR